MVACGSGGLSFGAIRGVEARIFRGLAGIPLSCVSSATRNSVVGAIIASVSVISANLLRNFARVFSNVIAVLNALVFVFAVG